MKPIILGTAGHIDHGKTSLIRAVTGINTDRLKEEQLRGITIELGFASMTLPNGWKLGIVDVPGHEKFVKNMVAGATGIDLVAMIIAADEGVMPQTREHMEICTLLGIKHGLTVITKTDLVDEEWLELVTDDIASFTHGTFLEDAPVVPVSSETGAGVDEFTRILAELCADIPARSHSGLFRLPVDRVFSMKGFGTVITGTLVSGKVTAGETIMIYPSRITSKVRGVQVHNQSVAEAEAGMRTAVNFQGLDKERVNRGDVLSVPDALVPSYMLDVSVHFLKSNKKPIKNRTRVRFHAGTSEVLGNIILLDSEEIAPGETALAQIRLDAPVTLIRDDRFVLRSYSPVRTIGGGRILNPLPVKHKRFRPEVAAGLRLLAEGAPMDVLVHHLQASGYNGVSFSQLKLMTNLDDKRLEQILHELMSKRIIIQADRENRVFIHQDGFEGLRSEITAYLGAYHQANPLKAGMQKEELKTKFPPVLNPKLFNAVLDRMIKQNEIAQEEKSIRLAGHKISLKIDQAEIKEKIQAAYRSGGLTPPYFKELVRDFDMDPAQAKAVLSLLVEEGRLVKAKEDLFFHIQPISDLKGKVVDFLTRHAEMTTPQFKEMTGVSRKYLIPLLEYFDSRNVTIRVGDARKLRSG